MAPDTSELRGERDGTLFLAIRDAARTLEMECYEWAQGEIKDLVMKTDALEPTNEGDFREAIRQCGEDLRDIDKRKLPAAKKAMNAKVYELNQGPTAVYDTVSDALEALAEGMRKFESVIDELNNKRQFVDQLWDD